MEKNCEFAGSSLVFVRKDFMGLTSFEISKYMRGPPFSILSQQNEAVKVPRAPTIRLLANQMIYAAFSPAVYYGVRKRAFYFMSKSGLA